MAVLAWLVCCAALQVVAMLKGACSYHFGAADEVMCSVWKKAW